MKFLLLAFLLSACSISTITSKNLNLRTQADIKNMWVKSDGSWGFEQMDHSTPTRAGGTAIAGGAAAFGSAIATSGVLGAFH